MHFVVLWVSGLALYYDEAQNLKHVLFFQGSLNSPVIDWWLYATRNSEHRVPNTTPTHTPPSQNKAQKSSG